jgi:hypothetical protein
MNNSIIRVFNVKREITLFNLPQLWYTTSIKYMFIVLFVLLFYIVHSCIYGNTVVISRMDSNLYPVKKIRKVCIVVE